MQNQGSQNKIATVFGGTGFLGRYVVGRLAQQGYIVRVVSRSPRSAYFLKPYGDVGQIDAVSCSLFDSSSLEKTISQSDVVINLIGILFEKGKSRFERMHHEFPSLLAQACKKQKVNRLIHVSALGADEKSSSKYQQSKARGEKALLKNFPEATIFRPSVIFGAEDNFINQFASLAGKLPFLPLIGGGRTLFQPVYVCDVADGLIKALQTKQSKGKIYECGGPDIFSFKEILTYILQETGIKKPLVHIPWGLAKTQALFLQLLPTPLLTRDQVESLKTDNIVQKNAQKTTLTLETLGVHTKSLKSVAPDYLERFKTRNKFFRQKKA